LRKATQKLVKEPTLNWFFASTLFSFECTSSSKEFKIPEPEAI
jgi:hypothetical protein